MNIDDFKLGEIYASVDQIMEPYIHLLYVDNGFFRALAASLRIYLYSFVCHAIIMKFSIAVQFEGATYVNDVANVDAQKLLKDNYYMFMLYRRNNHTSVKLLRVKCGVGWAVILRPTG